MDINEIKHLAGEFINSNEFVAQAKFISETLGGGFPTSFPHYQRIGVKAVKAKGNPFSDCGKAIEPSCS